MRSRLFLGQLRFLHLLLHLQAFLVVFLGEAHVPQELRVHLQKE